MKISKNLKSAENYIKSNVVSDDVIFFNFQISGALAVAIYIDSLSDKTIIGKQVIEPLQKRKITKLTDISKLVTLPETQVLSNYSDAINKIILGDAVIFINGYDKAISVASKKPSTRAVTEPPTSSILKGPREGFVENIQTNISLVRQRLKTPSLAVEKLIVGKQSQTTISLVYLSSIANDKLVKTIRDKINKINVDGIIDSSYIIKCISDRKTSMFKQMGTTEKPDIFSAKLLEGRVGIIVDGSPIALTAPFIFLEDFQSSEDYYINAYRANFARILRILAVILSILLPAFFVAAQL